MKSIILVECEPAEACEICHFYDEKCDVCMFSSSYMPCSNTGAFKQVEIDESAIKEVDGEQVR